MRALAGLAVAGVVLAGCLDDGGGEDGGGGQVPAPPETLVGRLALDVPAFSWEAQAGIDWWETFVTTYQKRDAMLPNNQGAADFIAQGLRDAGLETEILQYPLSDPLPAVGPATIHVVAGVKRGATDPGHAVALGAHYDTQAATVQGAYDNGAGTAMVYNTCKALAAVPMDKTLLCLFFDGEEEGLLGSSRYQESPPASHPAIEYYLGYDMTGINWPGYPDWKLHAWVQDAFSASLFPFVNDTVHQVLGWPGSGAEVFPFNDRNSDESVFIAAGIPTVRFAGGRTAGAYPQYHMPDDTVEFVYGFVGGRPNFEAGFGAIVQLSFQLALMLDGASIQDLEEEYL